MAKIILMISIISSFLLASDTSIFDHKTEKPKEVDNTKMCNLFTKKIADYKATMRDDAYAQATLQSYKDRAAVYCKK